MQQPQNALFIFNAMYNAWHNASQPCSGLNYDKLTLFLSKCNATTTKCLVYLLLNTMQQMLKKTHFEKSNTHARPFLRSL